MIGGDGSFLRLIKKNQFDSKVYYVGVNTSTLVFLQEINPNDLLKKLGIQENKITTKKK